MTAPSLPDNAHVYEKKSVMKTTLADMLAFHSSPRALQILTPPPVFFRVRRDTRTSISAGELEFTLWFGPVPLAWHVQHEAGPTADSFADRMLAGPMAYWRHEHIFREVENGVELTDRVTLAHKPGIRGIFTRLMFDGLLLRILFFYRHLRTRHAITTG
jgi:ligand-binding SRPBCC domain-containing protein